jgi:SAM-dependent methyltransferase
MLPGPIAGQRVLDLGSGPGHYSLGLAEADARVVAIDRGHADVTAAAGAGIPASTADAAALPFVDGTFDGVLCSNMLEHTPDVGAVLDEISRVVRPGGWAWVSWTNWYSPWGGHAIAPLHYLGPRLGLRAWRALFGEPKGRNLPFVNLWPTHIGATLRQVRRHPRLELVDARPRYYPSQRWIVRVPGLREVATWNCLLVLRRKIS